MDLVRLQPATISFFGSLAIIYSRTCNMMHFFSSLIKYALKVRILNLMDSMEIEVAGVIMNLYCTC